MQHDAPLVEKPHEQAIANNLRVTVESFSYQEVIVLAIEKDAARKGYHPAEADSANNDEQLQAEQSVSNSEKEAANANGDEAGEEFRWFPRVL